MEKQNYIVHPHKFNMWLFILSLIMIFGGLTSAYIVARSMVPNDQVIIFDLPGILWANTAVILFSSLTMHFSLWAVKRREHQRALLGLAMTFVLGVVFLIGQWEAMKEMTATQDLPFVDPRRADNSVSFFYIFSVLHGLHIVGGLAVLVVALIQTSLNNFNPGRKVLTYEITSTFWHFLDLLWVYLFIFLLVTQSREWMMGGSI
ncbi:MAG: cytochrome c oxidase subunit 3 [Bacteroidota bacterium]